MWVVLCHSCVTHRCVNNCDHTYLALTSFCIICSRVLCVVQSFDLCLFVQAVECFNYYLLTLGIETSSKGRTQSSDKTISSKRRKVSSTTNSSVTSTSTSASTTTSTSSLPQAASEEQHVQRIAVAVSQALRDQSSTNTQACSTTPSLSDQPSSLPLVQRSVSEAIQRITGVNQTAETSTDPSTSKSQFTSIAAPLGFSVCTKTKNKIWGNEYVDLGLLLNL